MEMASNLNSLQIIRGGLFTYTNDTVIFHRLEFIAEESKV